MLLLNLLLLLLLVLVSPIHQTWTTATVNNQSLFEFNQNESANATLNVLRPEWIESVWQNADGSIKLPVTKDNVFVCVFDLVNGFAGLTTNLCLGGAILLNPRLRSQPIYLIHLSQVFGNVIAFSADIAEALIYLRPDEESERLCHYVVSTLGFSGCAFFVNKFLALIDRYVFMIDLEWYNRTVTSAQTSYVITVLVVLNVSVAIAFNWTYIFRVDSIRCAFHVNHVASGQVLVIFVASSFIVFFTIVFVKMTSLLQSTCAASPPPVADLMELAVVAAVAAPDEAAAGVVAAVVVESSINPATDEQQFKLEPSTSSINMIGDDIYASPPPLADADAATNSVENLDNDEHKRIAMLKSIKKFLWNMVPFLICPFLVLVTSLSAVPCLNSEWKDDSVCRVIVSLAKYDNKLLSFQSFVFPIVTWCMDDQLPRFFTDP